MWNLLLESSFEENILHIYKSWYMMVPFNQHVDTGMNNIVILGAPTLSYQLSMKTSLKIYTFT